MSVPLRIERWCWDFQLMRYYDAWPHHVQLILDGPNGHEAEIGIEHILVARRAEQVDFYIRFACI